MTEQLDHLDPLDAATRARLARLASVPVDTSRVARRLRAALAPVPRVHHLRRWWSMTGAAAALAAAVVLAVMLSGNSSALASPDDLAQVHRQIVSGQMPLMTVQTLDQANQMLAQQVGHASAMPTTMPAQVMSCCACEVCGRHVAAAALTYHGTAVTMMVAPSGAVQCRGMQMLTRDGQTYCIGRSGGLTMVMQERSGHWLCLVGGLSEDDLIGLARGVTF